MMAGKPIVASYSGYPSMLNEANAGVFIPTGDPDSIVKAIYYFKNMHPDERNLYGSRGKQWVEENHSYESIALRYYNKIMELF
jgi:glycosyltransferase involved in cell wall biosynthesis